MMKVTLVAVHSHPSPQAVPLACAFLKGFLLADPALAADVDVQIAEFYAQGDPEAAAQEILIRDPEVVAFSVYVWGSSFALSVARLLRQSRPGLVLCAGGAEASANPASLFTGDFFDFLIQGEGEVPFAEALRRLLHGRTLAGIPGLLQPGTPPPPSAPPVPLDTIPSPYLTGLIVPQEGGAALWQLSRGCDFACAFCYDGKTASAVRRYPLERVEAELRLLVESGVSQVFVLDSTFNKVPQRAKEILSLIRKVAPHVHFHFEVRSEFLDEEMAELFASITSSLQIGLQSAHPQILAAVGRRFNRNAFCDKVALLNESGAVFGFDLIYGLPGDTLPLFRESLDFALSLYPNHLDIFPLAVLPGTRLFTEAKGCGLAHLEEPPYTVTSTAEFSCAELEEARGLARACDIFYSRGKAVAWFNSVCAALRLSPSAFLQGFSRWLQQGNAPEEEELGDAEIWRLQHDFLREIFVTRHKERLLPVALDLARYHHLFAEALMAAPPTPPGKREIKRLDLLNTPLAVPPSAALARFHYPILELLEAGEVDLALFSSACRQSESFAVIYPYRGEVCTEDLPRHLFRLLEKLDGATRPKELCARLKIPAKESIDFLEFAILQGIVIPTHRG